MNMTDWYVNDELRRLGLDREGLPATTRRWREEWEMHYAPRRRPLLAWTGDRLVGLGERLRGWSAPAPQGMLSEQ